MRQVVAVARIDTEHLLGLLFERREVARMPSSIPSRAQNLAGIVVDHRLADVGSGPGCIDAARVGGLERVICGADRLHRAARGLCCSPRPSGSWSDAATRTSR